MRFPFAIYRLILVLLLPLAVVPALAQDATTYPLVQASVEPTSGVIGTRLTLKVQATAPRADGLSVLMPDDEPTTWAILTREPEHTDMDGSGGRQIRIYTYQIAPFATGRLTVPRVAVTWQDGATSATALTEPLQVQVDSVLPAGENNLSDAPPPGVIPIPRPVVYSSLIFLGLILIAIGYFLWRRYASRLRNILGGPLRPDQQAIRDINRLEEERLVEQKKIKEYYTRLTEVVRHYLSTAYGIHAEDLTSTELLRALDDLSTETPGHHAPAYRQAIARLGELLNESDLVKFARFQPEASQCRRALTAARDIVELTRYKFEPEPESRPTSNQGARS